jgi:hypothetical protein
MIQTAPKKINRFSGCQVAMVFVSDRMIYNQPTATQSQGAFYL